MAYPRRRPLLTVAPPPQALPTPTEPLYRNDIASRRNVQLFQEPDGDTFKAQVNVTEDEDLNVNPKSESELHEDQPTSQN